MAKPQRSAAGPMASIVGLLFVAVLAFIIWQAVSSVYAILSALSIPLFILAMFLNFTVVKNYFGWLVDNVKKNPIKGVAIGVASYLGAPFVATWLAFKAYTTRKLAKATRQKATNKKPGEDYLKYEEVEAIDDEDFLELEDIDKPREKVIQTQSRTQNTKGNTSKNDNNYDDLFS